MDHREFRDKLTKAINFDNITQEQAVQSIKVAWQMGQQIAVPMEQAQIAAELAEFFTAEVIRIEAEQE